MSKLTIADIVNEKVEAVVYGIPIGGSIGNSKDFSNGLNQGQAGAADLVRATAISIGGRCIPVSLILVVFGGGAASDNKCGKGDPDEKMWTIPLNSPVAIFREEVAKLGTLVAEVQGGIGILGLSISFSGVRENNGVISGRVIINWEENIAGQRVVIVRQSLAFSITGRARIYEDSFDVIWGVRVSVYVDVYAKLNPNNICVESRARWPGGNVGDTHCEPF
ncbi:hypothetical protein [Pseudomonas siliginis]|uniref:Uncharacterized protein n=1 Tax=Pseudomonas siliginis TaxID=2842346 RepID=A0ABY5C8Q4_9PSED|nr:hypothetical protein [Pseudomonas siliginis]UST83308.1 hypothetical protein NF677_17385 [Pseudomonas siliginis]